MPLGSSLPCLKGRLLGTLCIYKTEATNMSPSSFLLFSFFFFTFSTLLHPDVPGPSTQGHHMESSGPALQLERSYTVQEFWPLQSKRPESFIEHIGREREDEDKTPPQQEGPSRMEKRLYGGNTQRKRYPRMPATQCRLLREPLGDGHSVLSLGIY